MGKLNIAHHKSYHPYRADNIERVRRDEEEAQRKEEREEGRMMLADSEARLDLLRDRASGSSSSKKRAARAKDEADMKKISQGTQGLIDDPSTAVTSLTTTSGHINLFASLETAMSGQQLQLLEKKAKEAAAAKEADKGAPLAPSAHDLKPWYADRELKGGKERDMERDQRAKDQHRLRQTAWKSSSDPLKAMDAHLAKREQVLASSSSSSTDVRPRPRPTFDRPAAESDPARASRLNRESSERARAEALIARRKREMEGTNSSIAADTPRDYGDVFNVRETREAAERRRGWGSRRWDDDASDRDRGRRHW